jgi:hypothetical protein
MPEQKIRTGRCGVQGAQLAPGNQVAIEYLFHAVSLQLAALRSVMPAGLGHRSPK